MELKLKAERLCEGQKNELRSRKRADFASDIATNNPEEAVLKNIDAIRKIQAWRNNKAIYFLKRTRLGWVSSSADEEDANYLGRAERI